jgi:hypothetical protein
MFGEPISVYTSDDAIEDGCLVPASPSTHPNWLLTRAVYERIVEVEGFKDDGTDPDNAPYSLRWRQRVIPLLVDAALIASKRKDHLWTEGLEGNLTGKMLWIAANDQGGLTIMFPEDY